MKVYICIGIIVKGLVYLGGKGEIIRLILGKFVWDSINFYLLFWYND